MDLLEQRLPALPAVGGPARMWSAAGSALTRGRVLLEPQDPLDLSQLCICVLERSRPPHEHVDPDPVPDRHLIYEPAEVPLKLCDAGVELFPAAFEVDDAGAL
jgi:hypothetical protein